MSIFGFLYYARFYLPQEQCMNPLSRISHMSFYLVQQLSDSVMNERRNDKSIIRTMINKIFSIQMRKSHLVLFYLPDHIYIYVYI